jgi:hypothetical protein
MAVEMFGPRSLDALSWAEQIRLLRGQRTIQSEDFVLGLALCRDQTVRSILALKCLALKWPDGIPQIQNARPPLELPLYMALVQLLDTGRTA